VEINKSKWNLKRNSRIKVEHKEESNWKLINKRGNQRGIKVEYKGNSRNQSGISKWNLKWKSTNQSGIQNGNQKTSNKLKKKQELGMFGRKNVPSFEMNH
jgi:hypothetical protein